MNTLISKKTELEKFTATMLEPGIIENYIKPGMHMESRDAWELKKTNRELSEDGNYVVLVASGHLSSISKGAREVVASKEFVGHTLAKAILVESLGHRIVGNFYLSVNKPFIRTKIFTERQDALNWLREQLHRS